MSDAVDLDIDIDVAAAISEARASLEHERCAVYLPSFFDVDPGTRAMATEIARLRDANVEMMAKLHAKADRLPRDLWEVYTDILQASDVRDHDSARADIAYRDWCKVGRGPRPTSNLGGYLDAFRAVCDRPVSCAYEGFRRAARDARGWRDLGRALSVLSECFNVAMRMPDDVVMRHIAEDAAMSAYDRSSDDE